LVISYSRYTLLDGADSLRSRGNVLEADPGATGAARPDRFSSGGNNVSFTDALQPIGQPTGLSAEAQAARQPALQIPAKELSPMPVPQSVPQAEWTAQCDDAVAALVSLKIPKRESSALVRQSPGATVQEILRQALKIRGQGRGHFAGTVDGHAPSTELL
jgi:hypothetical protein